jgi:chromate transporter
MMVGIVDIPTVVVFAVALAALFYFKSKLAIPLVVASATFVGFVMSFVSV